MLCQVAKTCFELEMLLHQAPESLRIQLYAIMPGSLRIFKILDFLSSPLTSIADYSPVFCLSHMVTVDNSEQYIWEDRENVFYSVPPTKHNERQVHCI